MRRWSIVGIMLMFLVCCPLVFRGVEDDRWQDMEKMQRPALRGLSGIYVLVEYMTPVAEEAGLTRSSIQTYVELRLRAAGIEVLTKEESLATLWSPYLYVNAHAEKHDEVYVFQYSVEFKDRVYLRRAPTVEVTAVTWETPSYIGAASRSRLRESKDYLGELIDRFINSYLAANPKD